VADSTPSQCTPYAAGDACGRKGAFPPPLGLCLLLVPMTWRSVRHRLRHYSSPAAYVGVIRSAIIFFTVSNTVAVVGFILR